MATYQNISLDDMGEFLELQGFKPLNVAGTVERVFGKRVDQDNTQMTLRVYTGINPNGASRDVGEDAIRVNLFMRTPTGTVLKIGGSKRVHRVEGWRKNLQDRLDNWLEYLPEHTCECGLPMIPRKSKKSKEKFLGCCSWPLCKKTKKI